MPAIEPLGVKGVGEGGTVAATPVLMNAILDALAVLNVSDVAMPANCRAGLARGSQAHAKRTATQLME